MAEDSYDSRNSGDGGPKLMPTIYWQGSYRELERSIRSLQREHYTLWWHLTHRYFRGVETREVIRYRRTTKGPMPEVPSHSELLCVIDTMPERQMYVKLYRWPVEVEPRFVEKGIDRLLETMYDGDTSQIQLPQALLYLALGKEPPDGRPPRTSQVPRATLNPASSLW
jgi:hypothetical protein